MKTASADILIDTIYDWVSKSCLDCRPELDLSQLNGSAHGDATLTGDAPTPGELDLVQRSRRRQKARVRIMTALLNRVGGSSGLRR
jgi:hypothetical protein